MSSCCVDNKSKEVANKGKGTVAPNHAVVTVSCPLVLQALELSFDPSIIRSERMTTLVCTALPEITQIVRRAKETLNTFVGPNESRVRYYLNLDDAPFRAIRKFDRAIEDLPKDDEHRMALQALFLIVLRPEVPMKYRNTDAFLIGFPEFRDRSLIELEKLRMTANWMDLAFFTLSPKSNKTLLMNLIPRLCEGRSAKYVTGSGQSRATSDRVLIYHREGKCDKISRPQRKKQKVVAVDEDAIAKLTAITNLQAELVNELNNQLPSTSHHSSFSSLFSDTTSSSSSSLNSSTKTDIATGSDDRSLNNGAQSVGDHDSRDDGDNMSSCSGLDLLSRISNSIITTNDGNASPGNPRDCRTEADKAATTNRSSVGCRTSCNHSCGGSGSSGNDDSGGKTYVGAENEECQSSSSCCKLRTSGERIDTVYGRGTDKTTLPYDCCDVRDDCNNTAYSRQSRSQPSSHSREGVLGVCDSNNQRSGAAAPAASTSNDESRKNRTAPMNFKLPPPPVRATAAAESAIASRASAGMCRAPGTESSMPVGSEKFNPGTIRNVLPLAIPLTSGGYAMAQPVMYAALPQSSADRQRPGVNTKQLTVQRPHSNDKSNRPSSPIVTSATTTSASSMQPLSGRSDSTASPRLWGVYPGNVISAGVPGAPVTHLMPLFLQPHHVVYYPGALPPTLSVSGPPPPPQMPPIPHYFLAPQQNRGDAHGAHSLPPHNSPRPGYVPSDHRDAAVASPAAAKKKRSGAAASLDQHQVQKQANRQHKT